MKYILGKMGSLLPFEINLERCVVNNKSSEIRLTLGGIKCNITALINDSNQ